jgi:hypothetical protein
MVLVANNSTYSNGESLPEGLAKNSEIKSPLVEVCGMIPPEALKLILPSENPKQEGELTVGTTLMPQLVPANTLPATSNATKTDNSLMV